MLLLPYLEDGELYREFHLDEPWDSPHNRPLLDRMPGIYRPAPGNWVPRTPSRLIRSRRCARALVIKARHWLLLVPPLTMIVLRPQPGPGEERWKELTGIRRQR